MQDDNVQDSSTRLKVLSVYSTCHRGDPHTVTDHFVVAGPSIWNILPTVIRHCPVKDSGDWQRLTYLDDNCSTSAFELVPEKCTYLLIYLITCTCTYKYPSTLIFGYLYLYFNYCYSMVLSTCTEVLCCSTYCITEWSWNFDSVQILVPSDIDIVFDVSFCRYNF